MEPGKLRANQERGKTELHRRRRPQGEAGKLGRTFAARGLGQQHGKHLGVELVRVLNLDQIGKEMEIVDDTELDDLFVGAVVGHQIAAERREMSRVLVIDMHLLARVSREQNRQQESCKVALKPEAYHLRAQRYNKKRAATSGPCKNT